MSYVNQFEEQQIKQYQLEEQQKEQFKQVEQEMDLRDQFAMRAMEALIGQSHQQMHTHTTPIKGDGKDTFEYEVESDGEWVERIEKKIEGITILAYKFADEMRKARLSAFK